MVLSGGIASLARNHKLTSAIVLHKHGQHGHDRPAARALECLLRVREARERLEVASGGEDDLALAAPRLVQGVLRSDPDVGRCFDAVVARVRSYV